MYRRNPRPHAARGDPATPPLPARASLRRFDPRSARLFRSPPGAVGFLVLLSMLWPAAGAARAQEIELRLVPSAGVFVPTSVLYRSDNPPAEAKLTTAPVVGAGLHAMMDDFAVSLRTTVERVAWFDTRVRGRIPRPGVPEEEYSVIPFTVPTTITVFTADLLMHPYVEWDRVAPYLFVGFGWKRYSFGEETPADDVGFKFPDDGSSGRLHFGAGLELLLRGRALITEIAGNFNRFVLVDDEAGLTRPHPQHEVVLNVMVPLRILSF